MPIPLPSSRLSSGLLAGAALLGTLSVLGCVKQQNYQPNTATDPVAVAAPAAPAEVAVVDDYVYYPEYEIYYSAHRHQYGYRDGNGWAWRPAPPRVSVNVLFASPSVHMDFHDSPERHHGDVIRNYPHNWKQPDQGHGERKH